MIAGSRFRFALAMMRCPLPLFDAAPSARRSASSLRLGRRSFEVGIGRDGRHRHSHRGAKPGFNAASIGTLRLRGTQRRALFHRRDNSIFARKVQTQKAALTRS